jgi:PHD/YefM family antitoxin component YafN of YafNO toxin-antitoxin module
MTSTMETVTIPKQEFESMKRELESLRNSRLYQRLLEFENNIAKGKRFTRNDLGF